MHKKEEKRTKIEKLKKARQEWYDGLSDDDKQAILDLPNFDAEKFEKCTLINVNANNKDEIKQKIAELEEEIKKLKERV